MLGRRGPREVFREILKMVLCRTITSVKVGGVDETLVYIVNEIDSLIIKPKAKNNEIE